MRYRESMMCKWKLGYRDSKVGCSKIMLDYAVVVINTTMQ